MNVLTSCVRAGIEVIEVPVRTIYHDKTNSCSHFRRIRDSFRIYRNLLKFSLSSFSSFLLDYLLFIGFAKLFPPGAANVFARIFSGAYNYALNCRLVFCRGDNPRTAAEYFSLAVFILALNSFLLQIFLSLHVSVKAAKILTETALFFISWGVQKKIIFRHSDSGDSIFVGAVERHEKTAYFGG